MFLANNTLTTYNILDWSILTPTTSYPRAEAGSPKVVCRMLSPHWIVLCLEAAKTLKCVAYLQGVGPLKCLYLVPGPFLLPVSHKVNISHLLEANTSHGVSHEEPGAE